MSTLEKDKQKYHHGDLRNTLIQIGTEMLIESGADELSLRKIAQRAGVSHNAPYQHFADKNALLAAIAEEGFRLLGDAIDEALQNSQTLSPHARLLAVSRAYVAFALQYPTHLQLMFGAFASETYPSLANRSHQTLAKLMSVVAELEQAGQLAENPIYDVGMVVWIALHGLSVILNAGKIPDYIRQDRTPEILVNQFIDMICKGLLK
ncbi:MAG: TetR/AcrR family transcriptional regulator [Anaerolineae bacterium]|nr:TetR/AcrR family transcriptional regulator [Anaerolineae bacterium]